VSASTFVYVGELAAVAGAYAVTAELSLRLAMVHGQVTPVWPPTGIAVVALFLLGRRLWPAIAVAAFLVNAPISPSLLAAAGIAVGNTIAPVAAVTVLRRVEFRPELDRLRDAVALVSAALGSMLISATMGTATMVMSGCIPATAFLSTWSVWWTGDAMGVLMFAPFLFSVRLLSFPKRLDVPRTVEYILMFASTLLVAVAVFHSHLPIVYVVFPFLVWSAWRFGLPGAATSALVVSAIAIDAAARGTGPFSNERLFQEMVTLQVFNASVAFASFVVAAIVAERTRGRAELERALELEHEGAERLRAIDDLRRTFLHAVSHELRTPLTSVLGISLTLQSREVALEPPEQEELIDRLAANARRLDLLLRDLLDLDRLDRGILEPTLESTDLGKLVTEIVSGMEILKPRRVHLLAEHAVVLADASKVERIVENLLANAVRHTPADSSIWVLVLASGAGAVIAVEDDGPGVPVEHRSAVFEPFKQSGSEARPSPGLGIGLSLVARFADLHGGRAWVEERPGGGASFRVFLPHRQD
jgi:signal transduction histidine kinase